MVNYLSSYLSASFAINNGKVLYTDENNKWITINYDFYNPIIVSGDYSYVYVIGRMKYLDIFYIYDIKSDKVYKVDNENKIQNIKRSYGKKFRTEDIVLSFKNFYSVLDEFGYNNKNFQTITSMTVYSKDPNIIFFSGKRAIIKFDISNNESKFLLSCFDEPIIKIVERSGWLWVGTSNNIYYLPTLTTRQPRSLKNMEEMNFNNSIIDFTVSHKTVDKNVVSTIFIIIKGKNDENYLLRVTKDEILIEDQPSNIKAITQGSKKSYVIV